MKAKITNRELVLLYCFSEEKISKIKSVLSVIGARVKVVLPEEYGLPIGAVAGNMPKTSLKNEVPEESAEQGEMMIICGFTSSRMDELLRRLRNSSVGAVPYKAVLTPTNAEWSGTKLYQALVEEHEYMHNLHNMNREGKEQ